MKSNYRIALHQRRQELKNRTGAPQATKVEEDHALNETAIALEQQKSEEEFIVGADQSEELSESDFLQLPSPKEQKTKTEKKP